jgi:hypothetical protein
MILLVNGVQALQFKDDVHSVLRISSAHSKLWNSLNNDTRGETNFRIFKNLVQTLN